MSSYDRRSLLLSLAALGGCGFTPALESLDNTLRGTVRIDEPADRASFQLMRQIEKRFGRPTTALYGLTVALKLSSEGLAISGSNNITRYNLTGIGAYSLRSLSNGKLLTRDRVENFTSYSASQQPVATRAAERDAQERLMVTLADKITAQLLIWHARAT